MPIAPRVVPPLGGTATILGFLPCLGILNWIAIPLDCTAALLGLIGLVSDKEPEGKGAFLAALVTGLVLGSVLVLRCFLGGGVV